MSTLAPLTRDGFVVLSLDEGDARAFVEGLGPVIDHTEVRLREGVDTWLTSPEAIPPHTDDPRARWIGWWCGRQDTDDGANLLVDGGEALRSLEAPCVAALERVTFTIRGHAFPHPAVSSTGGLFYAPWLHFSTPDDEAREAVQALRVALADPTHQRKVLLEPGQLLVVDNHRILHGRGALAPDSPRHLTRWWVGS